MNAVDETGITDTPIHPLGPGELRLDQLSRGERATVKCLACKHKELRNKLLTMGLVEGSEVEVLHIAPLGDPMSIKVLGFQLSLRLSEAAHIVVTPK